MFFVHNYSGTTALSSTEPLYFYCNIIMGWHIGMTEEEMREFAGMSCPISQGKENNKKEASKSQEEPKPKPLSEKPKQAVSSQPSTSGKSGNTACPLPPSSLPPPPPPDVQYIYHLCQKSKWEQAVKDHLPYFPPTYMKDGKFTRASVYKEDMVSVANQYYQNTPGKWIVLELDCKLLYSLGIPILAQEAPESTLEAPVKCLQIFGGISTSLPLVHRIYPMFRKSVNGEFLKLLEPVPPTKCLKSSEQGTVGELKPGPSPEQPRTKKGLFGRLKKG
jgi:hypothetical protein